jgi:hypothetical protein
MTLGGARAHAHCLRAHIVPRSADRKRLHH